MDRDTLTIRQAAALLNVHPNTVRNRIKSGAYHAEKILTERGETYVIARSELARDLNANKLPGASQSQSLPDVRDGMRAMLEPFVRELGEVREELGREKERREQAERRVEALERQLEARESPESPGPSGHPTAPPEGPQAAPRRPWWRRVFGG